MTKLEQDLIGTAPKTNDIVMSRTTKNYLAGLNLASSAREIEYLRKLSAKDQKVALDLLAYLDTGAYQATIMSYILNAKELV